MEECSYWLDLHSLFTLLSYSTQGPGSRNSTTYMAHNTLVHRWLWARQLLNWGTWPYADHSLWEDKELTSTPLIRKHVSKPLLQQALLHRSSIWITSRLSLLHQWRMWREALRPIRAKKSAPDVPATRKGAQSCLFSVSWPSRTYKMVLQQYIVGTLPISSYSCWERKDWHANMTEGYVHMTGLWLRQGYASTTISHVSVNVCLLILKQ